jgi:hypothetical protein
MTMPLNELVYLYAHPDQPFCRGCLGRLAAPRVTSAEIATTRAKSYLEGPDACSACGTHTTVLKSSDATAPEIIQPNRFKFPF